ncbi:inorganic diphosphatase [Methanosphaera cuniculi]|uniref:inorganic diphosphatase n=1 Tax=Methanosphaera cuniculi TaxID=1077256 RepID=UPI0026EF3EC7|nr:inorganic diphosphatase [Methanosphaera cuniculi]
MNLWKDLKSGKNVPDTVTVVVEIPKGSRNKYEYEKDTESFKLDRVLYSPFHYPAEYGFIPQTLWDDGDPLDVLVIMDQPTFPGCLIDVRPVGVMRMIDDNESDDKILAVPLDDPRFNDITDIDELPDYYLKEIIHFFSEYKTLENKTVEITGWEDSENAKDAILHAIKLFKEDN